MDAVLGITQYNEIGGYLDRIFDEDGKIVDVITDMSVISCGERINTQSPFRADIKIARGMLEQLCILRHTFHTRALPKQG